MNLLNKKMIGLLGLMILGVFLCACGNKEQTRQNPSQGHKVADAETKEKEPEEISGVLVVYTDRIDKIQTKFAEYKAIFEAKHPGTEIVFKGFSDYETRVTAQMEKGEYGDVILIPHGISGDDLEFYFEPLGTVEELSETYQESYLQAAQCEGVVYGLAQYVTPLGIAYNKKVFEKAGIIELPRTPEDFLTALTQIQTSQSGVIPFYTGKKRPAGLAWWQQHVWGSVSGNPDYHYNRMITDEAPFSVGKPNYIAHKLLYDIVERGLCEEEKDSLNWKTVRKMLNDGEIGCVPVEWEEIAELQKASTNPDDIGYMPFPYHINDVQYAAATIGYCYAVNKNSQNKATAKAWIEYMSKDSGYAKSEGAVSILNKEELPDLLKSFQGVELVVEDDTSMEARENYDQLQALSGILQPGGTEKKQIIEAASQEETDFDNIMKEWNDRWKKALQGESSVE